MVYRTVSVDMKQRALQLLDSGWTIEEIVDALGVSTKSIERWSHNYETQGCVDKSRMVFPVCALAAA
jgi:transposase-like protein